MMECMRGVWVSVKSDGVYEGCVESVKNDRWSV